MAIYIDILSKTPRTSMTHGFGLVTDLGIIQRLLKCDRSTAEGLLYVDRGPEGGKMVTTGLYDSVSNKHPYKLTPIGFEPSSRTFSAIDLEYRAQNPVNIKKPPALSIKAKWDTNRYESGDQNNILGDNGRLELPCEFIDVPVVEATSETLAYYGALLIAPGEVVSFPDENYPIWHMEIGDEYIDRFLMQKEGGGFYLEYHTDQPHFHMALYGDGCYLLAKWADESQTTLEITGFKIPDSHAVYTKKGAIHCDAALKGEWLVGYTTSDHCSTVLLRDPEDRFVHMRFQD